MTVTAEQTTTSRHGKRRRFTRRRIVVIVLIVLVLLLVVAWFWTRAAASAEAARPRFATAETGSVSQTVDASGTIAAAREADLSFQVGGQVTAIPVTVGQQVTAGQVLATIDSASLPSQLAQAKATLAQNKAKRDADDNASSEQRAADDAAVNAAQAQLDSAQKQLDKATLTSTIDGTVAAVNLDVGQQVAAGAGGSASSGSSGSAGTGSAAAAASAASSGSTANSAATAQIVVVSTDASIVKASVDDTQVGRLKVGQQVDITPNGATTPVQGTVSEVGMVATQTSGVASYPVTVDVAPGTTGLHIGASAQLSILITKVDGVLTVPTAAIRQENGSSVVDQMRDGEQVSVPVTVGLSGGGRSEISSGLTAGAQVVLPSDTSTAARPAGGLFGGGGGGGGGNNNGGTARPGAGG